jgi:hypothetical protein
VSNRVDAYTEKGVEHFDVQPFTFSGKQNGKRKLICR